MHKYLLAEYCEGPFYMGWWLYERDRNDGSPNDDKWDTWGWLSKTPERLAPVRELVTSMGYDAPPLARFDQRFAEWFAATFSAGLLVQTEEGGRYRLIEVIGKPPKQISRRIIRTIRRAQRSFGKACAKNKQ